MKRLPRSLVLWPALVLGWVLLSGSALQAYHWGLPAWVPRPVEPADNPMSAAKVELGRHLFYDQRLSADNSMSCASCHHQDKAFTDGRALSEGVTKEQGSRSAMSLANVAYLPVLTWANPHLTALEVQALVPLFGEHPVEMGMAGREKELFARLQADARYRELFAKAFPAEASQGAQALYSLSTVTKALGSFQRSLLSFDSPYDRYQYGGQKDAISASAKRGEALFFGEKMECYHCHGGFTFTDNIRHQKLPLAEQGFHNTGLYNLDGRGAYPANNIGISELTGNPDDMGQFRTPTLRNVALTAPYMHDGSIPTLQQVIREHYAQAGRAGNTPAGPNPMRSSLIAGFEVSEQEVTDLVAFLNALTDKTFVQNPRHGNPWSVQR
ncbi:di-heme enzyme [Limnohabitans sp. MMS-10A-160]|uniref:methanobactin export MATE transporter MbnM n=1 Tax=unclassified Limnohabitans TaxID=2626134 RepID=UPI000DD19D0B|nr:MULTISPECIES: methanobactin export MATE transporter MbnM [unclassified Limnohabitans]PUE15385.1 di-heme enzyme [Limnohabitans sp. MMS-10A-192]PUE23146.1 di-heme enzyme [Limnohabitans sp. MMS-10A-160]